jgi:hypothetical protein
MNRFKPGVERLAEQSGAPVIPVALVGLWGSFFSKRHGKAFTKPFRRGWTPVGGPGWASLFRPGTSPPRTWPNESLNWVAGRRLRPAGARRVEEKRPGAARPGPLSFGRRLRYSTMGSRVMGSRSGSFGDLAEVGPSAAS